MSGHEMQVRCGYPLPRKESKKCGNLIGIVRDIDGCPTIVWEDWLQDWPHRTWVDVGKAIGVSAEIIGRWLIDRQPGYSFEHRLTPVVPGPIVSCRRCRDDLIVIDGSQLLARWHERKKRVHAAEIAHSAGAAKVISTT